MIKIFVIRHGETDFNAQGKYCGQTDISLNEMGISQARNLMTQIKNLGIKKIFCSPLKRAQETAGIINENLASEIIIDKNFVERSVGVFEGLTKIEVQTNFPDLCARNVMQIIDDAPPGGETYSAVIARVSASLAKIKTENIDAALIVTHGFTSKAINKYFNPQITEQEFFDFNLANSEVKEYFF